LRRRFPPPWSVEELEACFIVKDQAGQKLAFIYFEEEPGRRSAAKLLTRDEARQATSSFGRYQEELSVTCRWQGSFRRCLLTLEPCSFHAFSKSSFVGLLLELAIMARDDAVTKPHIRRRVRFLLDHFRYAPDDLRRRRVGFG
jgi:hypothetical protein